MKMLKRNKGITLIALIITIVIMLILAIVTIAAVKGEGIIGKAKKAKTDYQNAQVEEQNVINQYLAEMEGLIGNNSIGGNNTIIEDNNEPEEELKSNIASYTEEGVPIPVGFKYVEGTKDTGVVVENEADGSQFVWVPVTEEIVAYGLGTEGYREPDVIVKEWYSNGRFYRDGADNNPTYLNIVNNILGTSYSNSDGFLAALQEDFNLMAESVNKNNGFYVGRYETSLNGTRAQSVKEETSATAEESSANTWYGLYAYQKAYSTSSVQGSMIWGNQYDKMMIWMKNTGTNVDSGIGDDKNTARTTGTKETDKINNVYDLYGNSLESTLEATYIDKRVCRGFDGKDHYAPSSRNGVSPTNTYSRYGSRLALYIK